MDWKGARVKQKLVRSWLRESRQKVPWHGLVVAMEIWEESG